EAEGEGARVGEVFDQGRVNLGIHDGPPLAGAFAPGGSNDVGTVPHAVVVVTRLRRSAGRVKRRHLAVSVRGVAPGCGRARESYDGRLSEAPNARGARFPA